MKIIKTEDNHLLFQKWTEQYKCGNCGSTIEVDANDLLGTDCQREGVHIFFKCGHCGSREELDRASVPVYVQKTISFRSP